MVTPYKDAANDVMCIVVICIFFLLRFSIEFEQLISVNVAPLFFGQS